MAHAEIWDELRRESLIEELGSKKKKNPNTPQFTVLRNHLNNDVVNYGFKIKTTSGAVMLFDFATLFAMLQRSQLKADDAEIEVYMDKKVNMDWLLGTNLEEVQIEEETGSTKDQALAELTQWLNSVSDTPAPLPEANQKPAADTSKKRKAPAKPRKPRAPKAPKIPKIAEEQNVVSNAGEGDILAEAMTTSGINQEAP